MKTIIIDTGFWIALYNPEKEIDKQDIIELITDVINEYQVLIPFPTLYEFLNSKFSRKNNDINFKEKLSKSNYIMVDDAKYKQKALNNFFIKSTQSKTDVSLVDEVIKEMIDDTNLKTDFIVTFDKALENYALSKNVKFI
ncbi:hypothetical protein [Labilibaculum euxinus]